jgi:hypothetical protein
VRQFQLQTLWPALGAGVNEHSGYWPALGVHCHRAVIVKAVAYGLISSYQITLGRVHGSGWLQAGPRGISDCSSAANRNARYQIPAGAVPVA